MELKEVKAGEYYYAEFKTFDILRYVAVIKAKENGSFNTNRGSKNRRNQIKTRDGFSCTIRKRIILI